MNNYGFQLPTVQCAGTHLIVELWGVDAAILRDEKIIEQALVAGARIAGATVLHTHFHHFGGDYGVTGVVVLQESHISIHTWPEMDYAALDLFMCGACDPNDAMPKIVEALKPARVLTSQLMRGIIRPNSQRV